MMAWESSDVVRFDLGSLLQGQTRTAKLKSAENLLIIGPRGFQYLGYPILCTPRSPNHTKNCIFFVLFIL